MEITRTEKEKKKSLSFPLSSSLNRRYFSVFGVITASCVSIMTPMAAPCQIMIIEPGGYTLKDYLKCGTPLALILIVVSVFFLPTLYPFA